MLVVVALALAACSAGADDTSSGSGAPVIEDGNDAAAAAAAAAAAGDAGDGDGDAIGSPTDDVVPSAAGQADGSAGASGGASTSGGAAGGSSQQTPGGGSSGATSPGPGTVTRAPVEVGALYASNRSAFLEAFGVSGGEALDTVAAHDALAAAINAAGGLGGHEAVPVYHELDATSTESYSALAQKACVAFTEDNDAVAVVGATFQMAHCLAEHGAIGIDNADNIGGPDFMREVDDHYYSSSSMNYDRKAAAWLSGLDAVGYIDPSGIYGLIHYDVPGMPSSVDNVLIPGLERRGVSLEVRVEVVFPDSTAGAGSTVAQIQNAVLQFRSRNVDHLLIYDVNATMPVFFMQQAASQSYEPRYALESDSHLNFMLNNVPASQLTDSVAVGWRPIDDQLADDRPAPLTQRCFAIMEAAGVGLPDHATREAAVNICDWWFFLDHVYDRAGGVGTAEQFAATVEAMRDSYQSARTYRTFFAAGRPHDGVAQVQPLRYDEACPCYVRVGGLIDLA